MELHNTCKKIIDFWYSDKVPLEALTEVEFPAEFQQYNIKVRTLPYQVLENEDEVFESESDCDYYHCIYFDLDNQPHCLEIYSPDNWKAYSVK
jgi:hypothetical protein